MAINKYFTDHIAVSRSNEFNRSINSFIDIYNEYRKTTDDIFNYSGEYNNETILRCMAHKSSTSVKSIVNALAEDLYVPDGIKLKIFSKRATENVIVMRIGYINFTIVIFNIGNKDFYDKMHDFMTNVDMKYKNFMILYESIHSCIFYNAYPDIDKYHLPTLHEFMTSDKYNKLRFNRRIDITTDPNINKILKLANQRRLIFIGAYVLKNVYNYKFSSDVTSSDRIDVIFLGNLHRLKERLRNVKSTMTVTDAMFGSAYLEFKGRSKIIRIYDGRYYQFPTNSIHRYINIGTASLILKYIMSDMITTKNYKALPEIYKIINIINWNNELFRSDKGQLGQSLSTYYRYNKRQFGEKPWEYKKTIIRGQEKF